MAETASITKVIPPKKETLPVFSQIHIGHDYLDFDTDAFFTMMLARGAGMIDAHTPVHFSHTPPEEALNSASALVIEGIPKKHQEKINTGGKDSLNNFDNGPNGEPAAYMFYGAYQSRWQDNPDRKKLADLANWINARENPQHVQPKSPETLNEADLAVLAKIFSALHHEHTNDPDSMIKSGFTLMDQLFDSNRTQPLTDLYEPQIKAYEQAQKANLERLRTRAREPNALQRAHTVTGLELTYFDIRNLEISKGGLQVAKEFLPDSDIIVLVDDEWQSTTSGKEKIGTRFVIANKADSGTAAAELNMPDLLAARLDLAETMFGKGATTASFGGHKGIVVSARGGSELNPEAVWSAMQDFFDSAPLTRDEFTSQIAAFAATAGISNFHFELATSANQYALPEYTGFFTLPNGRVINIPEKDFPLYKTIFTDDIEANRQMLSRKTPKGEPKEITQLREQLTMEQFAVALVDGNATRALSKLNEISISTIQTIDPESLGSLIQLIANNPEAIAQIWDKDNSRFGITWHVMADWVTNNPETTKYAKYKYESLPTKIDSLIVPRWLNSLPKDANLQLHAGNTLINILETPAYKSTHNSAAYDKLLTTTLAFLSDTSTPKAIRSTLAHRLTQSYGAKMEAHWRKTAQTSQFWQAATEHPQAFQSLIETLQLTPLLAENTIPGIPDSRIRKFIDHEVSLHLEAQRAMGLEPTASVLVKIGGRDTETLMHEKGISTTRVGTDGSLILEPAPFPDAVIEGPQLLDLDQKLNQPWKIAEAAVLMVRELATALPPDAKIRIINGNLFGALGADIATQLALEFADKPDVLKRLIWCNFAQTIATHNGKPLPSPYYDRAVIPAAE